MSNPVPFFNTAKELRRGQFLEDCADELHRVIASVEETGKVGKLLIEIAVAPASKVHGAVVVSDKITVKLPQMPLGDTIMFVTPDNNLVANDPRQKEIVFKSVDTPINELKQVNE